NLGKSKQFIADYAFSYGGSGDISDYLNVLKFDNAQDEIEYIANDICLKLIKNNAKFDDFCVVLPSFDGVEEKVKHAFENLSIPYFIDKSKTLRDVSVFSFISKLINLPTNFSRENLMELLHNAYLNLDYYAVCDYCRNVIEKGLYGDALYQSEDENILSVLSTLKNMDTDSHTIGEHLNNMLGIFDKLNFVGALDIVMQSYKDNDIVEYRTLSQTQTKLAKIVEELNGVLGDYECDYSTFVLLMDSYIDNTSIALPPITSCVFVADQKSSYFAHKKYVYMLNVNEGIVPAYNADLGIISDDDMAKIDKKLSPTIAYTNKKIRYKVFENLFGADCTLTLCSVNMSGVGEKLYPASFLVNLANMGGVKEINGSACVDIINANFKKIDKQNVLFNNFSKSNAEKNFITLLKSANQIDNKTLNKLTATLGKVVNKPEYITNLHYENVKQPIDTNGVYFPYGKSSISQVQTYYKCPYKHFATYALRLKEQITDNIRPLDYGNIIHRFLELSVGLVENCDNLPKLAKDTIDKVLKEDEYIAIATNSKNIYNIKALKRECLRILKTIKNQLSVSEFKPKYYEKEFSGVDVKIGDKTITFGGVIDRVDTYDNYFRIIDYKTGSDDFKDFGEVAKGVRLQLIMYLKAYMDKTHLLPAGAFYMPISVSFDNKKDGDSMYKYKGIILNEINNMFAMDSTLREPRTSSKVINVAMDKDGKPTKTGANLRLSHDEIIKLTDYVYDMLVKAVEKILSGDISPEPYKNGNLKSCKYCPYKAMCNFSEDYKNKYNEYIKIESISEL
ncbi:MAG: PD-(D/E)XK nuclease family protein, partial [Clostridia bacterium]|nr:PD-(D/E)XK nuclease family protein [Clostridia bacterium]